MSDNMRYYNKARTVPKEAQKPFSNGRFSGTDINPMWRIRMLTEMFGPVGIGWYTEVTRQEVVPVDNDNMMVFVDINLYIREEGGEWSKPIFGTGGNTLKLKGKSDDEGYKKAYTDAMSIACKALGIGADIWYANDPTSKYSDMYTNGQNADTSPDARKSPSRPTSTQPKESVAQPQKTADRPQRSGLTQSSQQMATSEQKTYIIDHASDEDYMAIMQKYGAELETLTEKQADAVIKKLDDKAKAAEIPLSTTVTCERCGNPITGQALPDGTLMSASEIIGKSKVQYNGVYCFNCCKELKAARKAG